MTIPSNRSFTGQDLASLRRLIVCSHAASAKHSWVHLVDTQSMSPSINGDVDLLVEWTQLYCFCTGDLIVVSKPELPFLLVHRACRLRSGRYGDEVLQIADQFAYGDELSAGWIELQAILGRVICVRFRSTGRVVSLDSPPIRHLSQWIAKLSVQRLTQSQPETINQRLASSIETIQHRLVCHVFHVTLHFVAYLGFYKSSTCID